MSGETTYPWLRLLELEFEQEPKPIKRRATTHEFIPSPNLVNFITMCVAKSI